MGTYAIQSGVQSTGESTTVCGYTLLVVRPPASLHSEEIQAREVVGKLNPKPRLPLALVVVVELRQVDSLELDPINHRVRLDPFDGPIETDILALLESSCVVSREYLWSRAAKTYAHVVPPDARKLLPDVVPGGGTPAVAQEVPRRFIPRPLRYAVSVQQVLKWSSSSSDVLNVPPTSPGC